MCAAGLEAVAALDKYALDEIKCLAKPPEGVKDVVVAVALIMGATATEWKDCQKLMADKKLLSKMQDVDSIPHTQQSSRYVIDVFVS